LSEHQTPIPTERKGAQFFDELEAVGRGKKQNKNWLSRYFVAEHRRDNMNIFYFLDTIWSQNNMKHNEYKLQLFP